MLAVIRGLENWRHLLKGTKYKFEVWTDYKNLEYFMRAQKLNWRQACWTLYLSRFDFILKHVPGTKMGKADGLSRRPVKNTRSGLNFSYFLFLFLFSFNLFSFILFLEPELEEQDHAVTLPVTSGDTVTSHMMNGRM